MIKNLDKLKKEFLELTEKRDHTVIEMTLINKKQTILILKCNRCYTEFKTNGHNYSRAGGKATESNFLASENKHFFPYGCPGCKKKYKKEHIKRLKINIFFHMGVLAVKKNTKKNI